MPAVQSTRADWRCVADQLAGALQEAMLRNPGLTAAGWARAEAALGQYASATGADPETTTTEPAKARRAAPESPALPR